MPDEELADAVLPFLERHLGHPADRSLLLRIIPLVSERIKLLSEIVEMAGLLLHRWRPGIRRPTRLLGKRYAGDPAAAASGPRSGHRAVESKALESWYHESLEAAMRPLAEELGVKAGDLFGVDSRRRYG